jgi:hypothetical protein
MDATAWFRSFQAPQLPVPTGEFNENSNGEFNGSFNGNFTREQNYLAPGHLRARFASGFFLEPNRRRLGTAASAKEPGTNFCPIAKAIRER